MPVASLAYQRILVPLDGSETAEFAVPYAVDLARRHDAELVLLYLEFLPALVSESDDAEQIEQAKASVIDLRNQLRADGLRVRDVMLESRNLSESLFQFVESEHISVVVMSTQGHQPMMRWLFGSQFETALMTSPVPIMLVQPVYHKIVVPLDGSGWSETAIGPATELARAHNAEVVLLHVYQSPVGEYEGQISLAGQQQIADQTYDQMHDQLVALRNMLRHEGLRAEERIIRSNNPAQAISDFVRNEEGVTMIVMSTHGRTGISRWLFGSVAQKVSKNLRCPVTLVRPD
ncbi:MAG TPA: universal stress protein [Aggregatilinea sp.]|uniref:universal stress protein n=1 Tax=Aggregatilinea sp. TaxID=2806333 RepID=UPI002C63739C|nr:universal stress protein [Aggregatilinea sp.]HML21087.1 universal stress protein [Aggregatilinea sp.]